jgi:hypothetical protein
MNRSFDSVIDILVAAETTRKKGIQRALTVLSVDPKSTVAGMLDETESAIGNKGLHALSEILDKVAEIVRTHRVQRSITDWPFENFWGNPTEPKHSKLLGYFINPEGDHGCGSFLLKKLIAVFSDALKESGCLPHTPQLLPADNCQIRVESNLDGLVDGRIDLYIERNSDDGKYAIIVENKINWACDQDDQLQKYVKGVQGRGHQIYVFYIPLTKDKDPDRGDINEIKKAGASYCKITYETHILRWLDVVLSKKCETEWPSGMQHGMRENLSHYYNLIRCLIQKQKEHMIDTKILEQLRNAENNNAAPTLADLDALKKSTDALEACVKLVFRGKLLLKIHERLCDEKPWFCFDGKPDSKENLTLPYDTQLEHNVDL